MAAVAQLGPQAVGAVSQFAHTLEFAYLCKAHRHAQAGGSGSPAARPQEHCVLVFQLCVQLTHSPGHGVFHPLRQLQVWLHFYQDPVAHRDADISAHEVALYSEEEVLHLGHDPRLAQAVGLEGTALEQVHPVVPLPVEITSVFHVHRVGVLLLEHGHYPGHGLGEIGASQHAPEVYYKWGGLVVNTQLPVAGDGGHIRLHEQRGVGAHIFPVQLLQLPVGKGIVTQVDKVHTML